ncbi:uncharacterized protein EI97DRAFT_437562 [Westerdykella ornata]|uniref:Uncharacterized protein n=1 Tax=Westerdykella ornata TaxID=318751 RepID=A0A6A6J987_WESOR|nr:uncharacterized protein EI97DRAFT_437562 [Westerdykella ornata]KAF2271779.1 hypothetical protein EI97DRAFT_437562 [Westerdykella ornata]
MAPRFPFGMAYPSSALQALVVGLRGQAARFGDLLRDSKLTLSVKMIDDLSVLSDEGIQPREIETLICEGVNNDMVPASIRDQTSVALVASLFPLFPV